MLQLTVENGAKLLPDVPKGTGGNYKSQFKYLPVPNSLLNHHKYYNL